MLFNIYVFKCKNKKHYLLTMAKCNIIKLRKSLEAQTCNLVHVGTQTIHLDDDELTMSKFPSAWLRNCNSCSLLCTFLLVSD